MICGSYCIWDLCYACILSVLLVFLMIKHRHNHSLTQHTTTYSTVSTVTQYRFFNIVKGLIFVTVTRVIKTAKREEKETVKELFLIATKEERTLLLCLACAFCMNIFFLFCDLDVTKLHLHLLVFTSSGLLHVVVCVQLNHQRGALISEVFDFRSC